MTVDIKPGSVPVEKLRTGVNEVSAELFGYQHTAPNCKVEITVENCPDRTYRLRCKTHNTTSGIALTDYIPK